MDSTSATDLKPDKVNRYLACVAAVFWPLSYLAAVALMLESRPWWGRPIVGFHVSGVLLSGPFSGARTSGEWLLPSLAWGALLGWCVILVKTRAGDVHFGIHGVAMLLWMWLGAIAHG